MGGFFWGPGTSPGELEEMVRGQRGRRERRRALNLKAVESCQSRFRLIGQLSER